MVISDIQKNQTEIIRIEITEFKGQRLLNIRTWYLDKNSGEYKPTPKGVALKVELFAELKQALAKAEEALAGA